MRQPSSGAVTSSRTILPTGGRVHHDVSQTRVRATLAVLDYI